MKKYLNQTTVNVIAIAAGGAIAATMVSTLTSGRAPDNEMKKQMLTNRRLDYAIGRIKACGELKRYGVYIDPKSPDAALCSDVVVTPFEK